MATTDKPQSLELQKIEAYLEQKEPPVPVSSANQLATEGLQSQRLQVLSATLEALCVKLIERGILPSDALSNELQALRNGNPQGLF